MFSKTHVLCLMAFAIVAGVASAHIGKVSAKLPAALAEAPVIDLEPGAVTSHVWEGADEKGFSTIGVGPANYIRSDLWRTNPYSGREAVEPFLKEVKRSPAAIRHAGQKWYRADLLPLPDPNARLFRNGTWCGDQMCSGRFENERNCAQDCDPEPK